MKTNITNETKVKDFSKFTKQGYEIIDLIDIQGRKVVIFKRENQLFNRIDYNWGNYYNVEDGTWVYGHYCFETKLDVYRAILCFFSANQETYIEP